MVIPDLVGAVLPPGRLRSGPGTAPALGLRAGSTGFFILSQTES
jgi:hypothetical protein